MANRPKDQGLITQAQLKERLTYDPDSGTFRWRTSAGNNIAGGSTAGYLENSGYLRIKIDGRAYLAHRLAWLYAMGEWPSGYLDHIDGDRTNNAIANLRHATEAQNKQNSKKHRNNTSGFKGASFSKSAGKYVATIGVGGKRLKLGYFETAQEAHLAYLAKAKELFGEFARSK